MSVKEDVRATLAAMGDFADLLAVLGYRSERTLPGQTGDVADFMAQFPAPKANTKTEQTFGRCAQSVQIVFQVTSDEIASANQPAASFDEGQQQSFIFFAVALKEASYARGQYAQFTREINKRLRQPAVVLFKTADHRLTLAFVHRREHKRDGKRDVLGHVSLIREIAPANPHRAHLDILAELALPNLLAWMDARAKPHNFDGLLVAWLDKLDTEDLNRRFYCDLFGWFKRAVQEAKFPTDQARTRSAEEHVIRLITRLLFVWFIKEKGLIAEDLFIEAQVKNLLKSYARDAGDSYYRAVLQNLFFATLNTEIDKRGFSQVQTLTHRNFSLYRYKREISDPNALLALFAQTPFINGGLFDCLDSEEASCSGGYRIDCFSDVHYKKLSIPNRLFFADDGLITLFNHYKFTVEENTPVEQEVALDPELLGKVFENLLAAYNPETRETARKQTGSYYTPRAVVDYMVDEALVATLAEKARPDDGDAAYWQERLRYLLDYEDAFDDAHELFEEAEAEGVVRAIAEIKVLDPAVGSGAFPMGVLHKLTLALQRIDPGNLRWQVLQKERARAKADAAFETKDQRERDAELLEISETFERYSGDFGRKLYLIQNSIFGVDIQPIACQIAKLRFFISLAIEQKADETADNFGIKPLPNLETRFVAANTLLNLDEPTQMTLGQTGAVNRLERELNENRERHFHATTRQQKLEYRRQDARLRKKLAAELQSSLSAAAANQVAQWDPYDQNADADWFDAEYMFGIADGFDVVIGNPPYIESRNSLLSDALKDSYGNQVRTDWGETLPRGSDLLIYFYPRSVKLLHDLGCGCLITQNAWLSTDYGREFQKFSLGKFSFQKIIDTTAKFFSDVKSQNINAVITVFTKNQLQDIEYGVVNSAMEVVERRTIEARQTMKWGHLFFMPQFYADVLAKLSATSRTGSTITFGQGINFPKRKLDEYGSNVPVIVKDAQFVAVSADGRVREREISTRKKNKIPALIMPRGIGDRHYCTFNSCKAFSYSHVELYLPSDLWESKMHYCLWAYMNSSFVWLFREITGRKNLGGGMLKAEATDMKTLPVNFRFDFAEDAKEVFESIKNREPMSVAEEIYTDEHLLIDDMVADSLGFKDMLEDIRETLVRQVDFRLSKAQP